MEMKNPLIRRALQADAGRVLSLYREVAARPGGLARTVSEVDEVYVARCMSRANAGGLQLVLEDGGQLIAEIHAFKVEIACLDHVLSDLTIAVSPRRQGAGIGRYLFATFLRQVCETMPNITRVELIARESNVRAIQCYMSLGFSVEGRLRCRIRKSDGGIEDDIFMAWLKPGNTPAIAPPT